MMALDDQWWLRTASWRRHSHAYCIGDQHIGAGSLHSCLDLPAHTHTHTEVGAVTAEEFLSHPDHFSFHVGL